MSAFTLVGGLLTGALLLAGPAPALAYVGQDPRPVSSCTFTQLNVSLSVAGVRTYDFVALCSDYSFVGQGRWDPASKQTAERITMGDWKLSSSALCDADPWITGAPCREAQLAASAHRDMVYMAPPVSARVLGWPSNDAAARLAQAKPPIPNLPLPPLDVKAKSALGLAPTVSWSAADQSGNRPAEKFEIERQSPPGAGRPWIGEGSVAGPGGAQTASTRLAFKRQTSKVDARTRHAFRVCTVNAAGRACSAPVELESAVLTERATDTTVSRSSGGTSAAEALKRESVLSQGGGSSAAAALKRESVLQGSKTAAVMAGGLPARVKEQLKARVPASADKVTVTPQGAGVALAGTLATAAERDSVIEVAKSASGGAPVDGSKLLVAVPSALTPAHTLKPGTAGSGMAIPGR